LLAFASAIVDATSERTPAAAENNANPLSHVRRDNFRVDIVTS
jgi:hypothetical protein